jgi:hypothetical protein
MFKPRRKRKLKQVYSRHLYLSSEGTLELIEKCEKIMTREKWSFNRLVEEALKEYEQRHGAGNNSFQLDQFGITWTSAKSVSHCCFRNCEKLAEGTGLFVPRKQTLGLCSEHGDIVKSQPLVWRDLKFSNSKQESLK